MNLADKTLLLGRSQQDASYLQRLLLEQGAQIQCIPLIDIQFNPDLDKINFDTPFDYIVLTSKHAVAAYFQFVNNLAPHLIVVVGEKSAQALVAKGIEPFFVGSGKGALSLLQELEKKVSLKKKRLLYPCSSLVTDEFQARAKTLNAEVTMFPVYQNNCPKDLATAQLSGYDMVVFFSSSGVSNYFSIVKKTWTQKTIWVAIGESTKKTLQQVGVQHVICAGQPDETHVVKAIVAGFNAY